MPPSDIHQCLICNHSLGHELAYPRRGQTQHSVVKFEKIGLCPDCGLGIAFPHFSQQALDTFYQSGSYWHAVGDYPPQIAHEKVQSKLRVINCLPYLNARSALKVIDVGAGHGWTADWLAEYLPGRITRFDFVEPDDQNSQFILSRNNPFPVSRLDHIAGISDQYDLLFINHVLEHVADPVDFMLSIKNQLRDGGIAYIETPNSDYRFKDDVFPHTLFFTKRAFSLLAMRIDVEQLLCEEFGSWPALRPGWEWITHKLLSRAFHWSVKYGNWSLQEKIDRAIWKYQRAEQGIWLRWIIRKPGQPLQ